MSKYNNILKYDIFVFDFDGIIINSEKIHNLCWNEILKKYNLEFDYYNYCKTFHTNEINGIKKNLETNYNLNNFNIICDEKNTLYNKYINSNGVELIDGIYNFLNFLNFNNKMIIFASNTSKINIDFVIQSYLKDIKINEIYTKDDIKNKKPDPEIYNLIFNKYNDKKMIIFEDSLTGITSLYNSNLVNNNNKYIFLNSTDYYHYNFIISNHKNIININNYDLNMLNNLL